MMFSFWLWDETQSWPLIGMVGIIIFNVFCRKMSTIFAGADNTGLAQIGARANYKGQFRNTNPGLKLDFRSIGLLVFGLSVYQACLGEFQPIAKSVPGPHPLISGAKLRLLLHWGVSFPNSNDVLKF